MPLACPFASVDKARMRSWGAVSRGNSQTTLRANGGTQ